MSIVSFWFFVFVAAALLVYYLTPRRFRWMALFAASTAFFYFACGWKLYAVFAAQVLIAYVGVIHMHKFKFKTRVAVAVIVLEAAALILMKENSFFITGANIVTRLVGKPLDLPYFYWVAPLGMSYYTLMLISYVVNVLWGKAEVQRNPVKLALYAGFFPQMVSGPFARYEEISSELFEGKPFELERIQLGMQRFMWGLFKKLVLAERLSVIVATLYDSGLGGVWPPEPTGVFVLIGAFSYVLQLYTDFSGCMDIVIGVAQMFGVRLPENFNTPFYSTSLSEFWRRWHMTLGAWLKDYVMYPVQKGLVTKFGKAARKAFGKVWGKNLILYSSMFATWFCIGFWHGGSLKYICASGLFFFVMIVGGLILKPVFSRIIKFLKINTGAWSWTVFCRLRTTFLFTLSVSFGRTDRLIDGFSMWKRAFVYNPWVFFDKSLYRLGLDRENFWVLVFGLLILFVVSMIQQKGSAREVVAKQNIVFRWAIWLALFAAVLVFGMYGEDYNPSDFIYGGF